MKVIVKKNATSLKKWLNTSRSFKEWRHTMTTYEVAYKALTSKFGYDSVEYKKMVSEFAAEVVATLTDERHIAVVRAWEAEKVAK